MKGTKARLPTFDPETGEIKEVILYLYGGRPKPRDKNFSKVFHAFMEDVFRDKEVMAGPFRLIAYIMANKLNKDRLDFYLTVQEAMDNLGITRRTFYRWLSVLLRKGFIKRINTNYYVMRPYTVIVGKMANIDYFEEGQP
ncbi:MAG: replication/maintenance protein RepL [Thermocrinis sp.]|nr:replication/maintenance protein RepL [Thermocrinis sp.]MCI4458241.1 replication/maintenance protein RepL [Thermocrinis sp.]